MTEPEPQDIETTHFLPGMENVTEEQKEVAEMLFAVVETVSLAVAENIIQDQLENAKNDEARMSDLPADFYGDNGDMRPQYAHLVSLGMYGMGRAVSMVSSAYELLDVNAVIKAAPPENNMLRELAQMIANHPGAMLLPIEPGEIAEEDIPNLTLDRIAELAEAKGMPLHPMLQQKLDEGAGSSRVSDIGYMPIPLRSSDFEEESPELESPVDRTREEPLSTEEQDRVIEENVRRLSGE